MSSSQTRIGSSLVSLRCLSCSQNFTGTKRRNTIICKPLRQHILARDDCLDEYNSQGLFRRGKRLNLSTSIVILSPPSPDHSNSFSDNMSNQSAGTKRSHTDASPYEPPPKRVHLPKLTDDVLEVSFGALPKANMLLKGEKFTNKASFRATAQWKAPQTVELDNLFFHGSEFFSKFTSKALLNEPDASQLIAQAPPAANPPQVLDISNESAEDDSLIEHSDEESSDGDDGDDDNEGSQINPEEIDDDDDDSHVTSPRKAISNNNGMASVENANHNIGNASIARNSPQIANPQNQNQHQSFRLIERWEAQCRSATIRPEVQPDPHILSDLHLLQLQHKYSIPLSGIEAIRKWAHESYSNYHLVFQRKPSSQKKQMKNIRQAMGITVDDSFRKVAIDWLPENKKHPVHLRSFEDCLYELLSNQELVGAKGENLSLPHPSNPFASTPDKRPQFCSELHHGLWWSQTMEDCCQEEGEILVPIIGYMDGVSMDNNQRLPVTPFNITLGIFNTETRRKAEAWTTLLLYPDDNSEASIQKGTKPFHKLQNLHNTLHVAFTDLQELMNSGKSVKWKLPYGPSGELFLVKMKFAFCYVVGDTEMHDKLCGQYGPRTRGIKVICRHCNCPTNKLAKGGETFEGHVMFMPEILDPSTHGAAHFKMLSHHPIKNAFHDMYFGANKFNIHLATPGELLHMVQKGACVRVVEGLVNLWKDPSVQQDNVSAVTNNNN